MKNNFYTIGHLEIPQTMIMDVPLWWFDQNNKEDDSARFIFKTLKKLTKYGFDNDHLKWSNIYGHLFAISIHFEDNRHGKYWSIHLWDHTGGYSLISFTQICVNQFEDILTKENYQKLDDISTKFVKGMVNCSDCGKEINKINVAGQYFAGHYCQHCWDTKWKAIEAKETYD